MKYSLQDLIDIDHFQDLQDRLNEIYSFPSSIIDNDGNILTATAWQEICSQFHRQNKDAEKICIKSDQYIKDHIHEAKASLTYHCPHGLVDNAAPIIIDGVHYGNFFTGQFFLEKPNLDFFHSQAKKYGFDEKAYLRAVKKVPIWTQKQLDNYMFFIKGLIAVISENGLKRLKEIENRKQIEKSEKRYRSILKASLDGYWLADTKGRLIEVNKAYCLMSGYSEKELLDMTISDLEILETPELVNQHMKQVIEKGSDRFESQHRRKDGTSFDVEVSIQFRAEDGGQCVCFLRDITDQKQAHKSLLESEAKYRLLVENQTDLIVKVDLDGRFLFASPSYCNLFGKKEGVLLGKKFMPMVHEQDREMTETAMEALFKPPYTAYIEQRAMTKNGWRWLAWSDTAVLDEKGTVKEIIGVGRDITDRKQAEAALKKSDERLRLALDSVSDAVWDWRVDTGEIYFSTRWYTMLGYDPYEFPQEFETWQNLLHPDDLPESEAKIFRNLESAEPFEIEFRMRTKENQWRWILARGKAVEKNDQGKAVRMLGTHMDITERKRTEMALKESEVKWRNILVNTPQIGISLNPGAEITFVNEHFLALTGWKEHEVIGKRWFDLFIPENVRDEVRKVFFTVIKQKNTLGLSNYENEIIGKSGQVFNVAWSNVLTKDAKGNVVDVTCLGVDLTERRQAEKALRESEKKYRILFEHTGEGLFVVQDGRIVFQNPRTSELTGYSAEELQSRPFIEYIHEDDRKMVSDRHFRRIRGENPPARYVFRIIHQNGSIRWIELNAVIIQWREKTATLCFITDVSERRQAEQALKKSQRTLQATIDATPFPVAVVDLEDDNIFYWSHSALALFGHTAPTSTQWYEIAYPDPAYRQEVIDRWKPFLENARESGPPVNTGEYRISCRDGSVRICELFATILSDQLIVTFNDITERKQAENALENERRFLNAIFDNIEEAIVICNENGELVRFNEAARKLHGLPAQPIKPEQWSGYYNLFRKDGVTTLPVEEIPLYRALQGEHVRDSEIVVSSLSNNMPRYLVCNGQKLIGDTGKTIGAVVAMHDDTRRKMAEIEQNKLQAQLTQAQKMESVGRLAGGVAHDFNNMLSVILGNTEMVLEEIETTQPIYHNLQEIQNAAVRSTNVVRQLLAFARKQTIAPKVMDLNETVEEMLKMLRRLLGENIDLSWKPMADIWPVKIDSGQIDQILANLTVNARDAINGMGRLTIETGRQSFYQEYCNENPGLIPGDFVMLAVSDNGCGMDKTTLNNLFEPFYTTKDVGKGTGLGLSTVYGIVKQNNGFINVYSEPGQGSTFKIYLPRFFSDGNTDEAVPEKKATAWGTETILLVEDEPAILKMTRMILERKGYTVLSAATPAEAMKKAKNHSDVIDLLMTDVVMPEMNGRDLAEQITALYPNIRLLFMSGYTADVIAHQGVLDEGLAFIQKPFSTKDLGKKLWEILNISAEKPQEQSNSKNLLGE